MSTEQKQSIDHCQIQDTSSIHMFHQKPNYSQHCNQSSVSLSTDVFKVYTLQVKVNWQNYNSYIGIIHYMIKAIMLCITAQLK